MQKSENIKRILMNMFAAFLLFLGFKGVKFFAFALTCLFFTCFLLLLFIIICILCTKFFTKSTHNITFVYYTRMYYHIFITVCQAFSHSFHNYFAFFAFILKYGDEAPEMTLLNKAKISPLRGCRAKRYS